LLLLLLLLRLLRLVSGTRSGRLWRREEQDELIAKRSKSFQKPVAMPARDSRPALYLFLSAVTCHRFSPRRLDAATE